MPASPPEQSALRIGVDVGGTFTDLVCFDPDSGAVRVVKLPSTPPDYHVAVIEAVRQVTEPARPATIVHGSTVATNALLQRTGEPCAFVTTEGFGDMLLIGRQNRPHLYALNVTRPQPLTAEENWFTVHERIGARGEVVQALDESEIERLIEQMRGRGLKHVAVCLLFSFINDAHERLIGRRCEESGLTVSLSCDVLPEFREYERASTTVINASLRPTVQAYLESLERGLQEGSGFGVQGSVESEIPSAVVNPEPGTPNPSLRIMHSAGGTLGGEEAQRSAAKLVLSGPAGGVMGAAFVASAAGFRDVITYDMGGTSTDVATILDGRPQWTTSSRVDGLPIGLPTFDIQTVGAGGGSIAYLDAGGALRVGPRSAGAMPGPACYGRGGTEPTVTDANLVLGRVLPDRFAGGLMPINPDLAARTIEPLARSMSRSVIDAALGIVRIAENNMGHAIRAVTSRRGLDPRKFMLLSFGGAGGLHACALADSLEIPRVLIPPYCGVLSALGMVVTPPVADVSKTVVHLGEQLDDARLVAEFGGLSGQTLDVIPYEQTALVEAHADVRFRGQSHELKVRVDRPTRDHITQRFLEDYERAYGLAPTGRAIEIVTLRLRRAARVAELILPRIRAEASSPLGADVIDATGRRLRVPVLSRGVLLSKGTAAGPLLLIDPEATAYVTAGWQAQASETGSVLLTRTMDSQ